MPLVHEQIESATTAALFAAACEFQKAAGARPSFPPRFLLDSARCMARHVGMTEQRMQEILPQLACYQIFLHSALTADPRNFTEAPSRSSAAYHQIRSVLDALESHPQLSWCAPSTWPRCRSSRPSSPPPGPKSTSAADAMLATRNLSWLRTESWRWTADTGTF
jgi:hypothetical protein